MRKIECNELKTVVKNCGLSTKYDDNIGKKIIEIYHFHEWDHGYDSASYCVNLNGSVKETFEGTRRQFYADMKEMLNFLYDYINYNNITEFISAPLFSNPWISCISYDEVKDICLEMISFLKKNQIRKNSRSGIEFDVKEHKNILEMLIEGSFRGISNTYLLSPDQGVVLQPSHHFNFIFFMKDWEKEKKAIIELLKGYPNLRYYEGNIE